MAGRTEQHPNMPPVSLKVRRSQFAQFAQEGVNADREGYADLQSIVDAMQQRRIHHQARVRCPCSRCTMELIHVNTGQYCNHDPNAHFPNRKSDHYSYLVFAPAVVLEGSPTLASLALKRLRPFCRRELEQGFGSYVYPFSVSY